MKKINFEIYNPETGQIVDQQFRTGTMVQNMTQNQLSEHEEIKIGFVESEDNENIPESSRKMIEKKPLSKIEKL